MSDPILVDPHRSLWVSAHAGAGKTRVLIDRVARLLVAGTAPEQILCLTFTKAAAAEMSARLAKTLSTLSLADDATLRKTLAALHADTTDKTLLREARRLFARALETPGGLKIQTIHAFCERLLGRFPIEAGIAPGFEVLDERTAAELLHLAQTEVLSQVNDEEARDALALLARLGDGAALSTMVSALMAARRDLAGQGATLDLDTAAGRVMTALGLNEGETPATVERAFLEALPLEDIRKAASLLARSSVKDQERAARLQALTGAPPYARAAALDIYLRVFLTAKGEPAKDVCTQAIRKADPRIEGVLRSEQERVIRFCDAQKSAHAAQRAHAALLTGGRIVSRYEALKQRRGALDYDDLIAKTAQLFLRSSAAWVLYKLDNGIDHILVDEAQDTNPLQWQVITRLADEFFSGESARKIPRSIFAVGDEKQSIYRFQGADPAIFAQMEEHFDGKLRGIGAKLHSSPLNKSWRSTKPILNFVDAVFDDPSLNAQLSSGMVPLKHDLSRQGQAGLVELWPAEKPAEAKDPEPWNVPLDYEGPESPRAKLARKIAGTIRGWLDTSERLASQERAIRPGDIMILVRRRDVFVEEVIRALKILGIPVAGTDRLALTQHIAVMDLMALARFTLLPEDDLTLASVLKSPLFGFSDEDLFGIAHERPGTLWQALGARGHAAHERLSRFLTFAQAQTPFEFFSQILGSEGGRAQLIARLGADAEDPIDELLRVAAEFERLHPPALQSFLAWLEAGQTEVKRDMDQGHDEVRVMTVHGAKGLESNIVILPDTCALPHRTQRPCFLTVDGVPLWSQRNSDDPARLQAARQAQMAAGEAEHLRLLYVALTRARDRLYICGHETKKGRDPMSWHALAEAAMQKIGTAITLETGETLYRLEETQTAKPDGRPARDAEEGLTGAEPAWLKAPAKPEPPARRTVSPSSLGEEGLPAPPVLSPRQPGPQDRLRFERGRLIHKLLQILPGMEPVKRAEAAQRFLGLPRHGLSGEAQAEIAGRVLRVLAHPELAPLFAPGSRAEVPVAGQVELKTGAVPVFGIIDRLAVTETDVLIIDYKTNRPPPSRLDEVPAAYLRQMAAYGAVLAQVYPDCAIRAALLWTESLTLMSLPPDLLASALKSARPPG